MRYFKHTLFFYRWRFGVVSKYILGDCVKKGGENKCHAPYIHSKCELLIIISDAILSNWFEKKRTKECKMKKKSIIDSAFWNEGVVMCHTHLILWTLIMTIFLTKHFYAIKENALSIQRIHV